MRAGNLRHRITIERDEGVQDSHGQVIEDWQPWLTNEPAEWIDAGGGETLRGRSIEAHIRVVIQLRYRAGVTPKMRVQLLGTSRRANIEYAVDRDGRRRMLELHCTESA